MKKRSSFFRFVSNKYFIVSIVVLAIVGASYYATHRTVAPVFEYVEATIGDVVERVSVTGTIAPVDRADLAFQKSGVVSVIPVTVGMEVKKGDLIASINSASDAAALESAKAQLAELSRGLRPEEYLAYKAAVDSASTTRANTRISAVNSFRQAYIEAQGAVVKYLDVFFTNPQSSNPNIIFPTPSTNIQLGINSDRVAVTDTFTSWKRDTDTITTDNVSKYTIRAQVYIATIKNLANKVASVVNDLNRNNSGLTQQTIDTYVSTMNTAQTTLNQAIMTLSSADASLENAQSSYTQATNTFSLQMAGTSADAIAAQAAKVAGAQAELAKDTILSPIDGIITRADPRAGEFVTAGQVTFSVQNNSFKIDAFVPEADIAKISVGNKASSTLDAYGSNVDFPAEVVAIEPAETVIEGVSTYKVTLRFGDADGRIRSGMTANLEILTREALGVLRIPYRALVLTATSTMVRVVSEDGKSFSLYPVTTGLKGSDGTIEIVLGLSPGEKVVTYIKQ